MSNRPKKTLFSFTRKRVFDMLSACFTGFRVSDIDNKPGESSITFRFFGNDKLRIQESKDSVFLIPYRPYDRTMTRNSFTTRAEINKYLAGIFSGFNAIQNRVKEIENE